MLSGLAPISKGNHYAAFVDGVKPALCSLLSPGGEGTHRGADNAATT